MLKRKQIIPALVLAVSLLMITLVSTYAADTGEIEVTDDVLGIPLQRWSVAAASDGQDNTIIAWAQIDGSYPNPRKIYFRRYDSSGTSSPSVEVVALPSNQGGHLVDVAVNDSGAFVVTWTQSYTDADGDSVHAALFDSAGSVVRSAFQVNTSEIGNQGWPSAAIDDTGAFLIAWSQRDSTFNYVEEEIYAQRFDNLGQPVNGEMLVNTFTDGYQLQPDAAMSGSGEAVIVWHSESFSVQVEAIYGQLFNSDGSRNGGEILISAPSIQLTNPAVAMDDSSAFVAAWEGDIGSGGNVYARQFDASGVGLADEFLVNTETTYAQTWPDIAVDNLGNFAVVWTSDFQDGFAAGVYAKLYDRVGVQVGNEFRVNVVTEDYEEFPAVAMSDIDQYVFAWSRYNNPNSGREGIYARFFSGPSANNAPIAVDDNYMTDEDTSLTMNAPGVLANDDDVDGDSLTVSLETNVSHGNLTFNDDGSFSYVPQADYFGPDSFSYSASDGELTSNIATVNINVLLVNDVPVAGDDYATIDEDTAVTIDVAANDTDVESNLDPSSVTLTIQPANGTATNYADGTVTYTPDPDYNGPDSFSYQICDSDSLCDTAVITLTINPVNDAPVANAGSPYSGGEGSALALSGTASDVDGDALSYTWTSDGPCNFSDANTLNPTFTCDDNGSFTATLTIDDGTTSSSGSAVVTVANVAPTAAFAASSTSIKEGSSVTLAFSNQSDPSGADMVAGFTYRFDCDGDGAFEATGSSDNYNCSYSDDGTFTALGRIEDKDGGSSDYTASITVNNVAPTIDFIEAPTDPVAIDAQSVWIQLFFSDPGTADTHQIDVDWGDGTIDTVNGATSPASLSHTYTEVGVYSVDVTVTDNASESDSTVYDSIVVYDPYSGSVVGNGRITSQAGWCYDSALCGNLFGQVGRFSFHSDYQRGATVPTGYTKFIFRMAGFAFESTSIDWLVVNQGGTNAQFHGVGTINGQAATSNGDLYHFMIWAGDGTGSGGEDTFRIKIWYEDSGQEIVVYDIGAGETFDVGQIRVQTQ